jgi:hypothetical protein|mmetsp:Transcript_22880/g.60142  ORF Transcript_22880/g.60142 Transcript_22880/m.60142 type:complete len:98 (+) Transcript_22880:2944-3237(+)
MNQFSKRKKEEARAARAARAEPRGGRRGYGQGQGQRGASWDEQGQHLSAPRLKSSAEKGIPGARRAGKKRGRDHAEAPRVVVVKGSHATGLGYKRGQ